MKTSLFLLFLVLIAARLAAFDWPGGTITVTVTAQGREVFAGWVPSSPWGSASWTTDPVLELRDGGGGLVAQHTLTGGVTDWFDGGSRTATVSFTAPPGTYRFNGRTGTRHQRIAGEGWSGWRLDFDPIADPAPPNTPPTIVWIDAPVEAADGQSYIVSARGHDDDGNLAQVNVWKNGAPFAFAGGGNGTDGDSGNATTDPGPQTITFTAQAVDATGTASAVISHTLTITAPAPALFTLSTAAGAGGAVSAGGTYTAGTTVMVAATPDGAHDFAGWSGDAGGSANPLAVLMDQAKTVQANFTPKNFSLTTNASGGGNVTPGGNYPYGTTVTITAAADTTHRFVGWAGDASGSAPSIALTITRPLAVQAVFEPKTAQTIFFPAIGDQSVGASFALKVTSTSGLPVTLTVTGPATYAGGVLTLTGPGAVSVQATQPGDGYYLPAAPVTRAFNAAAPAVLRYRATGRTFLQTGRTPESIPYVIQPNP